MIAYHSGYHIQRGHGLGNIFSSLFRAIMPAAKSFISSSAGKTLKNIAVEGVTNVAKDLISGKKLKDTASSNLAQAKEKITEAVKRKIAGEEEKEEQSIPKPKKVQRKNIKFNPRRGYNIFDG